MLKFRVLDNIDDKMIAKLTAASTAAEEIVATQVMKDTRPFVPALTGSLDNRTRVKGNVIIYPGPYARYLYYGKLMVDPNTGSAWAQKGQTKVVTDKNLVYTTAYHPQAQSHWFEASKALNMDKWVKVAGEAVARELGK